MQCRTPLLIVFLVFSAAGGCYLIVSAAEANKRYYCGSHKILITIPHLNNNSNTNNITILVIFVIRRKAFRNKPQNKSHLPRLKDRFKDRD